MMVSRKALHATWHGQQLRVLHEQGSCSTKLEIHHTLEHDILIRRAEESRTVLHLLRALGRRSALGCLDVLLPAADSLLVSGRAPVLLGAQK